MKQIKTSVIGKNIVRRLLLICLGIFIISIIFIRFMLISPLEEQEIEKAITTNNQIMQQADIVLSDINVYANNVLYDIGLQQAYDQYLENESENQYYHLVCQSLNRIASTGNNVRGIIVQPSGSEIVFNSIVKIGPKDLEVLSSEWYQKIYSTPYSSGFYKGYTVGKGVYDTTDVYSSAYSKNMYVNNSCFTVTVFFKGNSILETTTVLAKDRLDSFIWMNLTGKPLYDGIKEGGLEDLVSTNITKSKLDNLNYSKMEGKYRFITHSQESNWVLISYLSEETIRKNYVTFIILIFIVFVMIFLGIIIVIPLVVLKYTRPIGILKNVMEEVSQGNLDAVSIIETNDEIGELSIHFNRMVYELKQYIDELFKKEEQEQKMKYSLLISQIDPHFIYNTMNNINILIKRGQNEDAINMNMALIRVLRDRLRIKDIAVFDSIEQEIMVLKQYILIQDYRYQNKIEIMWDIDNTLLNKIIPKNILQPIVENAYFHGMLDEEGNDRNGKILISIQYKNGKIIIKVEDDGVGIEPDKLEELNNIAFSDSGIKRGEHIGLENLKERLQYLYGNVDSFHVDSVKNQYTRVILILPDKDERITYEIQGF